MPPVCQYSTVSPAVWLSAGAPWPACQLLCLICHVIVITSPLACFRDNGTRPRLSLTKSDDFIIEQEHPFPLPACPAGSFCKAFTCCGNSCAKRALTCLWCEAHQKSESQHLSKTCCSVRWERNQPDFVSALKYLETRYNSVFQPLNVLFFYDYSSCWQVLGLLFDGLLQGLLAAACLAAEFSNVHVGVFWLDFWLLT